MELTTAKGTFLYEFLSNQSVEIIGYKGDHLLVTIPDQIENHPVTAIGDKAFLSQKEIETLILPSHLEHIGSWAFAHMDHLKKIELPAKAFTIGKQVFLDCPNLSEIRLFHLQASQESFCNKDPFLSVYTASVITTLKDMLLFTPQTIGTQSWYRDFDCGLLRLLGRPDDDGFEPVFYGWFDVEDYSDTQLPAYIKKRRLEKASLVLHRLLAPISLELEAESLYQDYIRKHMLTGVWDYILLEDNTNKVSYLKLLISLEAISEENAAGFLEDLVSNNAGEGAALLLQYMETHFVKQDFFSSLTL